MPFESTRQIDLLKHPILVSEKLCKIEYAFIYVLDEAWQNPKATEEGFFVKQIDHNSCETNEKLEGYVLLKTPIPDSYVIQLLNNTESILNQIKVKAADDSSTKGDFGFGRQGLAEPQIIALGAAENENREVNYYYSVAGKGSYRKYQVFVELTKTGDVVIISVRH